jgi:TonB family protein
MKPQKPCHALVNQNAFLVLPLIILLLATITSCSAGKKATKVQTEVAPSAPSSTLPPPQTQRTSRFEVVGTDTIYSYTKEMPVYPGGNEALMKFKGKNVKYASKVKKLGIEGVVIVRFIIEKDGSVSNTKIMLGASPSLDAEALRVTRLMPAWQPGKENGKNVKFMMMTNYSFLLNPQTPQEHHLL